MNTFLKLNEQQDTSIRKDRLLAPHERAKAFRRKKLLRKSVGSSGRETEVLSVKQLPKPLTVNNNNTTKTKINENNLRITRHSTAPTFDGLDCTPSQRINNRSKIAVEGSIRTGDQWTTGYGERRRQLRRIRAKEKTYYSSLTSASF